MSDSKVCKHKIGVQVNTWESLYKCNEVYCINCNAFFNGPNILFNKSFYDLLPFESIIHFENLYNDLSNYDKLELAKLKFKELKEKNINLKDSIIVEMINNESENKKYVKMKYN